MSSPPITLKFMDVCYSVKMEENKNGCENGLISRIFSSRGPTQSDLENPTAQIRGEHTILNGVTGMAFPGEILAVLGPSGSGKSTLLNALAGRLQARPGFTGTILANNEKLSKSVLKRTGFVAQDDILYPHLTVRETLIFCSLLKLPGSLTRREKTAAADSVIAELGLMKCENTIIGNSLVRGISGGERKRVSIAHEMLMNPSLLILDEPTSGLDSTTAYRLVSTLGSLAQKGKTVITSVHQPSSRVFQMFSSVLVLSDGKCLYFGKANEAMAYFESVQLSPAFPMNPADFLLDLANGVCQIDGVREREMPNMKQNLISTYNKLLAPKVKEACLDDTTPKEKLSSENAITHKGCGFLNQLTVLLQRGLKERKHEVFNSLRVFQVLAASLLSGTMWWRSHYENVNDRLGLLFFISIFWGVLPSCNAVFAFPQERAIFMKERASGMYTLPSYFIARILGDLPMELILPTLFLTILYWMADLKPDILSFWLTLLVLLGYVLVSQGLGLALGAIIMDAKQASTIATVTMLGFVLTGGYYVHNVPLCLVWMKYISTTFYSYRLLIYVQYGNGKVISSLLRCSHRGSDRASSCKFVEEDIQGQIHPATCVVILLMMFFGYRLMAYLALRQLKV
ncbi:unnamed protein product [Cuscuta epithymum]|uniref:ABC transporter domain-containing protein n=1 Tax=Cuscuta epithymum TaxID=186058 RepID=A0AAV0CRD9_9ASTE|nr:unnamed protein product [Cuscuta epithymum]